MIIPVRCFTCGKIIGNIWKKYTNLIETTTKGEALNTLNIKRICCRRMLITHVNIIDNMIKYNKYENVINNKKI